MRNTLSSGSVLRDRYVLESVCGRGGFGVTYRAWDPILDCALAIKEYNGYSAGEEGKSASSLRQQQKYQADLKRFLEEARLMARLRDLEGTVYVHDFFEENDTAYIVMEYLEGETLRERLKRTGKLPAEEAFSIMDMVLQALERLNARGVLHRDIAPDNIFLLDDGSIRLLDFGSAIEKSSLTCGAQAGGICIKPGYSAPEQYTSISAQGPWTDVYAAGATLYHMLTGAVPPDAEARKKGCLLQPPGKTACGIGKKTECVILKALELNEKERYSSAEEFRLQLTGANRRRKRPDRQIKKKSRTRSSVRVLLTAGVLLGGVLLLGAGVWKAENAETAAEKVQSADISVKTAETAETAEITKIAEPIEITETSKTTETTEASTTEETKNTETIEITTTEITTTEITGASARSAKGITTTGSTDEESRIKEIETGRKITEEDKQITEEAKQTTEEAKQITEEDKQLTEETENIVVEDTSAVRADKTNETDETGNTAQTAKTGTSGEAEETTRAGKQRRTQAVPETAPVPAASSNDPPLIPDFGG